MTSLEHVREVFAALTSGWQGGFLEYVHPDVEWEVLGTHPLAGHYRDREAFVAGTSARLAPHLRAALALEVVDVFVSGDRAVVELIGEAEQIDGQPYRNEYCWIVRFDSDGRIAQVRSYMDSVAVTRAMAAGGPSTAGGEGQTDGQQQAEDQLEPGGLA